MSMRLDRRMLVSGAMMAGAIAACGDVSAGRPRAALAGAPNPQANGVWIWMRACLEALEKAGVAMQLSANAALGREEDRTEMTGLGLVQLNDASISEATALSDLYVIAQLPFLFDDLGHFDRLISNEDFLAEVNADLRKAGLRLVDAAFLGGMSGLFTARRPVRQLSDMKGLRLRAMDRQDLFLIEAFGASGVQVAWEETPQALQTGIASGYLNPPLAPVLFGHGAYLRYFTDMRVTPAHRLIFVSLKWLHSLEDDRRAAVEAAFLAGRKANREWAQARLESDLASLAELDTETVPLSVEARAEFKAAARAAYPDYAPAAIVEKAFALTKEASS